MESNYAPKDCPYCLKKDCAIPIKYGEPNDKIFNLAQKGKIKLGGCNIMPEYTYYCTSCKTNILRKDLLNP